MADITEFPIPTAPLDPEFQATATHVQWRLTPTDPWVDLVALSELEGPQGPAGADGEDATPGLVPHVVVSASKTFLLSDANSEQQVDAAATLTIPTNALVAYTRGTKISVLSLTAGTVTVDASGGVTLNGTDGGAADVSGQYSGVVLTKVGPDAWVINGDHGGVA